MAVSPGGKGPEILVLAGLFLALTTISVIARCCCRVLLVKNFGIDDWLIVVTWAGYATLSSLIFTAVHHGLGQHITDVPIAEVSHTLMWWWICEPMFMVTTVLLKLSIGIMLLRLTVSRTHRVIIYVVLGVVVVYSGFFALLFILQCHPTAYFWTRILGGEGYCIDPTVATVAMYIYSVISCVSDWTLAILPIFMIWKLQLNSRTKVVVGILLSMGAIASTATIIRIPYIKRLSNSTDFLYANIPAVIWSIVEIGLGLTVACLATLRPFFRTFFSRSRFFGGRSDLTYPHQNDRKSWVRGKEQGYIRSNNATTGEQIKLTNDIRNMATVVGGKGDLERGGMKEGRSRTRTWSNMLSLNESEDELVGNDGKEEGITKTVVSTMTHEHVSK